MQIQCPVCGEKLLLPEGTAKNHMIQCPFCEKDLLIAGDLAFGSAIPLSPKQNSTQRIACPYCKQHYDLTSLRHLPMYNLLGCVKCLKHFVIPHSLLNNSGIIPETKKIPQPYMEENIQQEDNIQKIHHLPADTVPQEEKKNNLTGKQPPQAQEHTKDVSGSNNPEQPRTDSQKEPDMNKKIRRMAGNFLWLFLGGLPHSVITFLYGCFFCITIIGIPLGLQLFKVSKIYLSPFGAEITSKDENATGCLATGANILWLLLGGWLMALLNLLTGALLFCTIIGIPFAFQYFKLAKLVLTPFGKKVQLKADYKELIICIIAVLLVEWIIIPAIKTQIEERIIKPVLKVKSPYGTK